ncbi:MAG TPA: hypothetical protein VK463_05600 [Desulfomonilaceae bacterium]|nr:hypothetical protein [Desulfomonilaceae bacterium]
MKEKTIFFNPIRMISPKLDFEATRIEELHNAPVSEYFTLEEGLVVMVSKLIHMASLLKESFILDCPDEMKSCQLLAEAIHKQENWLTTNLVCSAASSSELCKVFMLFPGRLGRVATYLESILNCCRIKCRDHLVYTDRTYSEIEELFALAREMLINFRDAIIVPNQFILKQVITLAGSLEQACLDRQVSHIERLLNGSVIPRASAPYLDILDSTESIGRHVKEMAERLETLAIALPAARR